jgi:hypothetical protein
VKTEKTYNTDNRPGLVMNLMCSKSKEIFKYNSGVTFTLTKIIVLTEMGNTNKASKEKF